MPHFIFQREQRGCVILIGGDSALANALHAIVAQTNHVFFSVIHNTAKKPPTDTDKHFYADLSNAESVKSLYKRIATAGYRPELVIFQPEPPQPRTTLDITAHEAEIRWQGTGLSLFLVAQAALQVMTRNKRGSLLILGSTLAMKSQENMNLDTAMYAGLRALSQSLAREFHPQGIHVVYVAQSDLAGHDKNAKLTADLCWQLHQQPSNAWTQEVVISD
ncbi:MAG: SDR family oxidoreductase [Candidatus Saccharibacteria bacterium]|nr:SDR family oxidoreductase [Moraxellaceae bacterium]